MPQFTNPKVTTRLFNLYANFSGFTGLKEQTRRKSVRSTSPGCINRVYPRKAGVTEHGTNVN